MNKFNTPELRAAQMKRVMQQDTQGLIENLFWRWKDEKKYEDFEEYKAAITKHLQPLLPKGSKITNITKKFEITLEIPGFPYYPIIYCTDREFGWKSGKAVN